MGDSKMKIDWEIVIIFSLLIVGAPVGIGFMVLLASIGGC